MVTSIDGELKQAAKRCEGIAAAPIRTSKEAESTRSRCGFFQRATFVDRWLVRSILNRLGKPAIAVILQDGSRICSTPDEPETRVVIRNRSTLIRLIQQPSIAFAEGYRDGSIQVEGSLAALCEAVEKAAANHGSASRRKARRTWRGSGELRDARRNIHQHYDLGNDFYRLWLDRQLVYTCAYFPGPAMSLDSAQTAKLDLVCRKLNLHPGDEVIEAGCGWGALALHMARKYGVRVRAWNISREQIEYARKRAAREGLANRVHFIEDDWRNITGECDRFVSVGMLEHVGTENYTRLGQVIDRVLRPSGTGLIHTIGRNVAGPLNDWIQRDIFPGAEPPSLRQMADIFEPNGFSVLDVENLRRHYALTLRHWLDRFERCSDQVADMFDVGFVRTWRLYLTGSIAAFEIGGLQLFQVVFSHGDNNEIPWTRYSPVREELRP